MVCCCPSSYLEKFNQYKTNKYYANENIISPNDCRDALAAIRNYFYRKCLGIKNYIYNFFSEGLHFDNFFCNFVGESQNKVNSL